MQDHLWKKDDSTMLGEMSNGGVVTTSKEKQKIKSDSMVSVKLESQYVNEKSGREISYTLSSPYSPQAREG